MYCRHLLSFAFAASVAGDIVTISNTSPRLDAEGIIMDAHDGVIRQYGGLFHWYAMAYGPCNLSRADGCAGMFSPPHCGFQQNHSIKLYTSRNLTDWRFVRDVFPVSARPRAIYFRPQVVYNAATSLYVLWVNSVPTFGPGGVPDYFAATYTVATSATPEGPFVLAAASVKLRFSKLGVGDLSLFVDPADSTAAYVAYAGWSAGVHAVSVERLAPDFLSSLGATDPAQSSGVVTPDMYEAPLLFARHGSYYLSSGPVCCFCAAGAASHVWVAPSPLGPWVDTHTFIDPPGAANASLLGAQNSFIVDLPLAGGGSATMWAGDRWGASPSPSGAFSETPQYWGELLFNDSIVPPAVMPLSFVPSWSVDLAT